MNRYLDLSRPIIKRGSGCGDIESGEIKKLLALIKIEAFLKGY
jgi:hypothetical protein